MNVIFNPWPLKVIEMYFTSTKHDWPHRIILFAYSLSSNASPVQVNRFLIFNPGLIPLGKIDVPKHYCASTRHA